jgi:hypothetical protein
MRTLCTTVFTTAHEFAYRRKQSLRALLGLVGLFWFLCIPCLAQSELFALLPVLGRKDRVTLQSIGYPIRRISSHGATWLQAFNEANPAFLTTYRTRLSAKLQQIQAYDDLDAREQEDLEAELENPSDDFLTPRYVVLARGSDTWIIPEFLFVEHIAPRLLARNGDVLATHSKNSIDTMAANIRLLDHAFLLLRYNTNSIQIDLTIDEDSTLRPNTKRILDGSLLGEQESSMQEPLVLVAQRELGGSSLTFMVASENVTVQGRVKTRLHEQYREVAIVGRFPVIDIVNLNLFLESFDGLDHAQPQPQTDCWLPFKKRMFQP